MLLKKSYLILTPLLIIFIDGEIFHYSQKLTVRLNLYFCKEFLLPLLSMLLGAFGLRVSFFSLIFFHSFTSFFIFALFSEICKSEMHPVPILSECRTPPNLHYRKQTGLNTGAECGLNHPPAHDLCNPSIFQPASVRGVLVTYYRYRLEHHGSPDRKR